MNEMEGETSQSFENVFRIFSSKYTGSLVTRQQQALKDLIEVHSDGFRVDQLGEAESLIYLLLEQENKEPFLPYLCDIVLVCSKPFIRNKANAEYMAIDAICNLLLAIGRCLESGFVLLKVAAAEVLYTFAKGHDKGGPRRVDISAKNEYLDSEDMRPSSWSFNQHLLDQSGVVEIAVLVFNEEVERLFSHDADGDGIIDEHEYAQAQDHTLGDESSGPPVFMVSLMKMAFEMSSYRANALTLIRMNTPLLITRVVSSLRDFRKEEVGLMVQVLWNVIEHSIDRLNLRIAANRVQLLDKYRNANALYVLGNPETVGMLRTLLERLLMEGHQARDKELRNEVIVVSMMLATRSENHKYYNETGFLSLLLLYATAAEMELPTGCDMHHFSTCEKDDLQMKQLIWHLISTLCTHEESNLTVVSDSLLMKTALTYLDPNDKTNAVKHQWSPAQLAILQEEALSLLFQFAPKFPVRFQELGGTSIVLAFVRSVPNVNLLESALRFLRVSSTFEEIEKEISEQNGVQSMLELVCNPEISLVMKEHALALITTLCSKCTENRAVFRRSGGISSILPLMVYDTTNLAVSESFYEEVVHCVWQVVAFNAKSESQFILGLGIEQLLSLLESCSMSAKYTILGCLSDLMHNPAAGPYFAGWKSDVSGTRAVGLLLDLWIQVGNGTSVILTKPRSGFDAASTLLLSNGQQEQKNNGTLEINPERPLDYFRFSATGSSDNKKSCGRLKQNLLNLIKALEESQPSRKGAKNRSVNEVVKGESESHEEDLKTMRLSENKFLKDTVRGMRSRIYCVLQAAGFDTICEEDLTKDQHLALSVLKHFPKFVQGLAWEHVSGELQRRKVKPILDDRLLIQSHQAELEELAENVHNAQTARINDEVTHEEEKDEEFFGRILSQRDQEIQFLLLNNKAKRPKSITLAKRQESKQKKQEMLARSRVQKDDPKLNSFSGSDTK